MFNRLALVFMFGLFGSSVEAESFRCGPWIISEDLSPAEIKNKCGEPDEVTSETVEVRGPGAKRGFVVKIGTSTTERWTYRRGTQAPPVIVTIVDGKVKSVLRAR